MSQQTEYISQCSRCGSVEGGYACNEALCLIETQITFDYECEMIFTPTKPTKVAVPTVVKDSCRITCIQVHGDNQLRLALVSSKQWNQEQEELKNQEEFFLAEKHAYEKKKLEFQAQQEEALWHSWTVPGFSCDCTDKLCSCSFCKNLAILARAKKVQPLQLLIHKLMDLDTGLYFWNTSSLEILLGISDLFSYIIGDF